MNYELVKEKIKRIKDLDPKSKTFKFLPKVSDFYLKEFEEKFNVLLPTDFRKFITEIACGIVDEVYDSNILDYIKFYEHSVNDTIRNPSLEFPLTKRTVAYKITNDDYPKETDYKYFEYEEFSNGILPILNTGCGCYYFIVGNGKEYGNIWCDNYCSNDEVLPALDKENNFEKMNFIKWIDNQLERALNRFEE